MINLLPPKQKEEIVFKEKQKIILVLEILFLVFIISFSLILLSIKFFLSGNLEAEKLILKTKEKEFLLQKNLEDEIKNYNLILSNLNLFYQNQVKITPVLEKIAGLLPSETYLTNLNLSLKDKIVEISISGFSPNREVLFSLKENLEKEKSFKEVYFPPENWIKPTDINFIINFKINEHEK